MQTYLYKKSALLPTGHTVNLRVIYRNRYRAYITLRQRYARPSPCLRQLLPAGGSGKNHPRLRLRYFSRNRYPARGRAPFCRRVTHTLQLKILNMAIRITNIKHERYDTYRNNGRDARIPTLIRNKLQQDIP